MHSKTHQKHTRKRISTTTFKKEYQQRYLKKNINNNIQKKDVNNNIQKRISKKGWQQQHSKKDINRSKLKTLNKIVKKDHQQRQLRGCFTFRLYL